MKKILIGFVAICMIITATACGGGEESSALPADIVNAIVTPMNNPDMSEVTADRLTNYFNIADGLLESFSLYIEGSGGFADEVAVFKVADKKDISVVKKAIADRVAKRSKDFDGYKAEELAKVEDHVIEVNGKYILFVISNDNQSASSAFKEKLKN